MEINKQVLSRLNAAGFDLWDVYSEKSTVTSITFEDSRIEKITSGIDAGFGLRGLKSGKTFYAYTNDPSRLISAAEIITDGLKKEKEFSASLLNPALLNEIKNPSAGVKLEDKIRLLQEVDSYSRSIDARIKQVSATYSEKEIEVEIINDLGKIAREKRNYTNFVIQVIARSESGRIESCHSVISGYAGFEILGRDAVMKKAGAAAALALRLLDSEKKIAGEMPVIISSEAGGTMIHEAVGHSLEADLIQKDMSVYKGKIGTKAAADIVTVMDDATIPNNRGSFAFDDEGTPSQKKILIEKGVLKQFIYDRETAMKDKSAPTGNGRRESYKFRPIPRMTCTMIAPGAGKAEDLIKDTKKGLFVRKMGGGQVNTVTGEFIFEVKDGYMIEDGKIAYPVRDATMMGTGQEVLHSIDAICDDIGFDVGTCGKDGQGVPVADAQPTLRIPKILVGSK